MFRHLAIFLLPILLFNTVLAQHVDNGSLSHSGVLSGTVADGNSNARLGGATISVIGSNKRTTTDNDGKFTFSVLPAGTYEITVSYVGYNTKQITSIEIKAGEVTTLNITLDLAKSALKDVKVVVPARRENLGAVLNIRRNSAVVSEIISADMIKRSPDKNTSDVLKRVSGTTIQDNKFVVVRGMNDRYNEAMLNGALMPSSEPDRKTFAFDIFPADLVDNITVIKSATPELPGSFSGGLIQINTKDVPDKKFWSVKAGLGLNSQTTGKDVYTYKGSNKDWIGVDNHVRNLPYYFPSTEVYAAANLYQKAAYSRLFQNNWGYYKKSAPFNTSWQMSGGFTSKLSKTKDFPVLAAVMGVTYSSSYKFNKLRQLNYRQDGIYDTLFNYTDSATTRNVLSSALTNVTFKINPSNKIFFNNLYSVNSANQTVVRSGPFIDGGYTDTRATSFFFASNLLFNSQLGGDHQVTINKAKFRIRWLGFLTTLRRNEPDYRRNRYIQLEQGGTYYSEVSAVASASTSAGVHYFGKLKDNSSGLNLDISTPFEWWGNTQTLKFGGSLYSNSRERDARFLAAYIIDPGNFDNSIITQSQDSIFKIQNFNRKRGFIFYEDNRPLAYHYDGTIRTTSAYAMMDNRLTKQIRLTWGLRFEKYHNILNTGDAANNPLKIDLNYNDLLPSANFVYSVLPKANLRLSYSRTVARPQYRELANVLFYDFLSNITFVGNPDLKATHINNFDIRWEHFFQQSQYYSISVFYKKFKDAIEQYDAFPGADSRTISWENVTNAYNAGIELEGRKNFDFINPNLENLVAYVNLSFIKSEVKQHYDRPKDTTVIRPLQGQSPYVFNASLQYNEPKTKLAFSLLYNVIGPRIYITGGSTDLNTWEKPHALLDFKIQKTLLKDKGLLELTFADILHKNDYQYYNIVNNKKAQVYKSSIGRFTQEQTFGFNVSISASYKIF